MGRSPLLTWLSSLNGSALLYAAVVTVLLGAIITAALLPLTPND